MAARKPNNWFVNATNNSAGVFNKVWVSNGQTSNTIAGPYPSAVQAQAAAVKILGTQSITGWRGSLAVLGGALGAAASYTPYSVGDTITPSSINTGVNAGVTAGNIAGTVWGTLSNHHLWVRVGEAVVAIILLDVGLKAFTNSSVIETVAKKTPVGKAAKVFK
jgi:hypothetical protein